MFWLVTVASAHIALEDPQPRYPSDGSTDNKACPCGVGLSNRNCDVATDRSDPDRDEPRASTFQAGETITLRFRETIGHGGRYRVAFDLDGADLDDFNDQILLDVPDPSGSVGNLGQGDLWELVVTLPATPCDNCTLQLIQVMDGNTVDPVPDPVGRSSYYQCVDLVLVSDTGTDTDTDTDTPTDPTSSVSEPGETDDAKAGCGCTTTPTPWQPVLGLLAFAAAGVARKRVGKR